MGELLEGIGSPQTPEGGFQNNFLFQGKEREFSWGLCLYDFMTRTYDPLTGRMWQVDGADQFASIGNNTVNGVDLMNGVVHIAIGAVT